MTQPAECTCNVDNGYPCDLHCSEMEHHPDCGKLSVPDTMVYCQRCGGETSWCGCRYRCKTCS